MSSIPPLKRCSKCGVDKPLDQFHKRAASPDGLRPMCKLCVKAYQQEWKADPGVAEYRREYERARQQTEQRRLQQNASARNRYDRADNVAERQQETEQNRTRRQQARQAQLSDPAYQEKQRRKKRALKSSDKALAQRRKRRDERYQNEPGYRERMLQQQRERLPRYTEMVKRQRAKHTERYNNDPEYRKQVNARVNTQIHKRRARLSGGGSHTVKEWRALCEKYNHRCLCCGEEKPLTKDHVIPVFPDDPMMPGGSDNISNLQPLCLTCNLKKHNRYIDYRPAEGD